MSTLDAAMQDSLEAKILRAVDAREGYVPLEPNEERELTERSRRGDARAAWALALANHNFVRAVAARYVRDDMEIEDLVAEGLMGLHEAALRFDPSRGIKFISYGIWWIRRSILRHLRTFGHPVHVPKYKEHEMFEVWRAARRLGHELGRLATAEEVAQDTGRPMASVQECLALSLPAEDLGADGDGSVAATLPAAERGAEEDLLDAEQVERLLAALPGLPARDRFVLVRRFGLDDRGGTTLARLGEQVGLTKERVRQIEKGALQQLRGLLAGPDCRAA